jgi:hypothetical protein
MHHHTHLGNVFLTHTQFLQFREPSPHQSQGPILLPKEVQVPSKRNHKEAGSSGSRCTGLPSWSPYPSTAQEKQRLAQSIPLNCPFSAQILPTCTYTCNHLSVLPKVLFMFMSQYQACQGLHPTCNKLFLHPFCEPATGTPCHFALTEILLVTVLMPLHLCGFQLPN